MKRQNGFWKTEASLKDLYESPKWLFWRKLSSFCSKFIFKIILLVSQKWRIALFLSKFFSTTTSTSQYEREGSSLSLNHIQPYDLSWLGWVQPVYDHLRQARKTSTVKLITWGGQALLRTRTSEFLGVKCGSWDLLKRPVIPKCSGGGEPLT